MKERDYAWKEGVIYHSIHSDEYLWYTQKYSSSAVVGTITNFELILIWHLQHEFQASSIL